MCAGIARRTCCDRVVDDIQVLDAHEGGCSLDVQQLLLRLDADALHLAHMLINVGDVRLQSRPPVAVMRLS